MDNYFGAIPLNADKELFAEDLIFWFLNTRWHFCPHLLSRSDVSNSEVSKYREFIYNGFNETIKLAIQFIDEFLDTSTLTEFIDMAENDRLNDESFIEYSSSYKERYFRSGFEATGFLMYCTRIAIMAGHFYVRRKKDILHLANDLILKAFPEGDMFSGTWDTLNQAAEMFVRIEEDRAEILSPSDSSTEPSESSSEADDSSTEAGDEMDEEDWENLTEDDMSSSSGEDAVKVNEMA